MAWHGTAIREQNTNRIVANEWPGWLARYQAPRRICSCVVIFISFTCLRHTLVHTFMAVVKFIFVLDQFEPEEASFMRAIVHLRLQPSSCKMQHFICAAAAICIALHGNASHRNELDDDLDGEEDDGNDNVVVHSTARNQSHLPDCAM